MLSHFYLKINTLLIRLYYFLIYEAHHIMAGQRIFNTLLNQQISHYSPILRSTLFKVRITAHTSIYYSFLKFLFKGKLLNTSYIFWIIYEKELKHYKSKRTIFTLPESLDYGVLRALVIHSMHIIFEILSSFLLNSQ